MQVNHSSQFHLVLMLLSVLQNTPNSRLVLQSSDLHRAAPSSTRSTSLWELNTNIGPMLLYNWTKLAHILFVRARVRRLEKGELGLSRSQMTGPFINATHPGDVKTGQQQQAVEAYGAMGKLGVMAVLPLLNDPVDDYADQRCLQRLLKPLRRKRFKDSISYLIAKLLIL